MNQKIWQPEDLQLKEFEQFYKHEIAANSDIDYFKENLDNLVNGIQEAIHFANTTPPEKIIGHRKDGVLCLRGHLFNYYDRGGWDVIPIIYNFHSKHYDIDKKRMSEWAFEYRDLQMDSEQYKRLQFLIFVFLIDDQKIVIPFGKKFLYQPQNHYVFEQAKTQLEANRLKKIIEPLKSLKLKVL